LQCVAVCSSVLQCVAVGVQINVWYALSTHSLSIQFPYTRSQCAAVCCSVIQFGAVSCSVLHCVAVGMPIYV